MMKQETHEWLEFVQSSSIPLCELNDNDLPKGLGSGCLLDYNDRRFLLSVFHVTKRSSRWVIRLEYNDEIAQTEVYYLGRFNYLAEMKKGIPKINDIDFSFAEVPKNLTCRFQHRTPSGQCLIDRPRTIFSENDIDRPVADEFYAFAGEVNPAILKDENALIIEHQTYPGLRYDRSEGPYHCFRLPVKHPGHKSFQGCSGAPLINTKRKIVGLVCSGSMEKNEIYAINLVRYINGIELLYKAIENMNAQQSL